MLNLVLALSFLLNVLLVAAFVFQSYQSAKERQQLALLIKSHDVAEFVRADRALNEPETPLDEPPPPPVPLNNVDPQVVAAALEKRD